MSTSIKRGLLHSCGKKKSTSCKKYRENCMLDKKSSCGPQNSRKAAMAREHEAVAACDDAAAMFLRVLLQR